MRVFFYGLFMDETRLRELGLSPTHARVGLVQGYALHIGQRALLVRRPDTQAYGVTMSLSDHEIAMLYSTPGVEDYKPTEILVTYEDGATETVTVYNLAPQNATGSNTSYARSLAAVAQRLNFPKAYIKAIQRAAE